MKSIEKEIRKRKEDENEIRIVVHMTNHIFVLSFFFVFFTLFIISENNLLIGVRTSLFRESNRLICH